MISIFLNIITLIIVMTVWIYSSAVTEKKPEEETNLPPKGRIVLNNDGRIMYSMMYDDTEDFDRVYSEVFAQLLQRGKKDENWVIEIIPL